MSDYQNSDTAKWDADQVRRQTGETQKAAKGKKKRRFGWLIYLACVIVGSCLLAGLGWLAVNDVCALNKAPLTATIEVESGDSVGTVATKLKKAGLIDSKLLFMITSPVFHASRYIQPGVYELNTDMDYRALISSMGSSSANRMTTTVTIPEGMTEAQIFALLEEKGVSTVEQLEEAAANYDFKFSFLKGVVPLGDPKRLEGYLFPDTYEFYMGEEPVSVLNKMILRFDEIFTDEMRQEVQNDGRTIQDVVTVASMIEKETDGTDRANIASVIYNRLNNTSGGTNGYLQIDATIQYVLPEGEIVSEEDYQTVQSPYNTYLNRGLPPGPIANPGMESIMAALNPNSTNYYYYALGDDGVHHFFSSYSEHQAFLNS